MNVKKDKRFEREEYDIHSQAHIGFTQAAFGHKIEVPTADVILSPKIPAGTQSGSQFRLRGKGVIHGSSRGDHYVTVQVMTPKKISRQQKKLLEELDLKGE